MGAVTVDVPIDQIYLNNYLVLFGGAIFYYDYFLTLGQEIRHVWLAPRTTGVWIFLINRYFTFLTYLTVAIPSFTPFRDAQSCRQFILYFRVELILGVVIVGVTLILRTYALYQRNNKVLTLMVSVSAVLIAMACWASIGEESEINITHGCQWGLPVSAEIRGAVAWEALFVFDTMIFILTMFKTLKGRYQYLVGVSAVTELIFRDGAIYYAVMACANAANTATFYVLQPQLKGGLTYFATSISSTMISRLMLNIRQQISQPGPSSFSLVSETESVQFTSHIVSQSIIHMEDAQHRLQNMGLESLELPERGPQRV